MRGQCGAPAGTERTHTVDVFTRSDDAFPSARDGIEKMLVANADCIVAECPQDREDLIRLYGAREGKIELVTIVRTGESGFLDTDPHRLAAGMRHPLAKPGAAAAMGAAARRVACERFYIERLAADGLNMFAEVAA